MKMFNNGVSPKKRKSRRTVSNMGQLWNKPAPPKGKLAPHNGGRRRNKTRVSTSLMAQRTCEKCKMAIFGGDGSVEGPNRKMYHPNCFRCYDCKERCHFET